MSTRLLRLYHSLPPAARTVAVHLRGSYLRRWRYGPETPRLIERALEQETWGSERWRRWQEERLAFVLNHAATRVPYYRDAWAARRRRGDRSSSEVLANWPVLEKEAVRANPRAFVVDGVPTRHMLEEHTSGSTGKPLDLWWGLDAVRQIYALNEAYCSGWYGVTRHDRWAMLGGQLIVPAAQKTPPFWVWNGGLNQLYLSSFHLAHDLVPAYCDALVRHRVRFVAGYTSSLYQLALGVLRHGRRDLRMAVAFTHAEPVEAHQRQAISEAFNCPVAETYGNAEAVSRASQCRAGRLHLWPQVGLMEIASDDFQPVSPGESGEILSTGLINLEMPLIRYRIGDRAALMNPDDTCECGRALPGIASIDGRAEDTLYTRDGRAVQRFHAVFIGVHGVREAQVVQETRDHIRIRCVTADDFDAESRSLITQKLRDRMGDVQVSIDVLADIPREPSGKFRAVVCRLSKEDRDALTHSNKGPSQ